MATGMTTKEDVTRDEIVEELGGCGCYVHLIETVVCFTFMGMILFSATPNWWCVNNAKGSSCFKVENNISHPNCALKACRGLNGTQCSTYEYDTTDINTIVNEFDLVCDKDFIPSTINTIQIAGTLVGNLMAGHLAAMFCRRRFYSALNIVSIFNIVGFVSKSWQMFALARFFAGLGVGIYMTTQYCLVSEFSLAKWRVWIIGFPSWPIQTCLFALLTWLIQDWRYIHLMTGLLALLLIVCFMIPESSRVVAEYNRNKNFDASKVMSKIETKTYPKHSPLDLFKTKHLVKVTLLSALNCMALGLVSYGILFGIPLLSGNIYLNLILFSIVGTPSTALALWLQNRFCLRNTSVSCYVIVILGGLIVGIMQTFNAPHKDELTKAFALFANIGITTAWGLVQTMTVELYPTVIRNIACGTLSVTGRIGAIIGSQLVYLNIYVPGLLYYCCAAICMLCCIGVLFLPETKDGYLNDKIQQTKSDPHASAPDGEKDNTSKRTAQIFVLDIMKSQETEKTG